MCNATTPHCGYNDSSNILIGELYCPNTECSGKFCLHKKTFQSLGRSDYQCLQCTSVCQVRNISFERQKRFFFVVWSKNLHFWKESKVSSRCYWRCLLSWQVIFQEGKMRISWRLCNNCEILLWLWKLSCLVVCSLSSFHVTRTRKDDKNRKNTLLLCWKKMTLLPDKQFIHYCPISINQN